MRRKTDAGHEALHRLDHRREQARAIRIVVGTLAAGAISALTAVAIAALLP